MSKLIPNFLKIIPSYPVFIGMNCNEFVITQSSIIARLFPIRCSPHISISCHDVVMKGDCI